MNLDFAKVCGKHNAVYEAYYKQIDPKGSGAIEAMTAAKFLKKSGLSDVVLSRVWDLSDPNGKGFLDKPGFFVALKLVSLAQVGLVINMSNIYMETANPPKVGDLPKITPPRIQPLPVGYRDVGSNDWTISVIDRLKYDQLFESLKPVGGMLPGNKVKGVLMDSKLPMDTLGKIWDLADQDKDGNLDKHEFIVAMHLVYQTLEKRAVPDVLPTELRKAGAANIPPPPKPAPPVVMSAGMSSMPRAPSGEGFDDAGFVANFPKDIAPPPAIPPLPSTVPAAMARLPTMSTTKPLISTAPLIPIGAPPSLISTADWVVVPSELKRYEVIFRDSDRDKDGLVSGLEVKNVFLQSGVSQNCLAHIWALCDTNQSGKLTLEQFALAMWMVERKQNGIEPPQVLSANMVAPSMRSTESGEDLRSQEESKSTYSNPELNMISKEIEELANERRMLETEIAQREADIRIKSGEVRSLQSELDTLSATLKQLENQKGEAQKRLDDLKVQVNKIREQCQKQEDTINEQEGELNAKRSELQKLKDEEAALQKEYDENNRELLMLTQHLQNTQLKISSVRSMVSQLLETQRQMTDALLMCRAAIESQNGELVSEYQLKIEPDFSDARKTLEKTWNEVEAITESKDPFINADRTTNEFGINGFGGDPFSAISRGSHSGFDDSFSATRVFDSGFDAFGNSKIFGQQHDLFDGESFIGSQLTQSAEITELGRNEFGNDPFAALHAPTGQGQVLSPNAQRSLPPPRPESPSPALPPKKSKVPPPRPAPPRPVQAPGRPTPMDNFGHAPTSAGIDGTFADFADFDNKLSNIPIPSPSTTKSTLPVITSTDTIGKTLEIPSLFEMKASASSLQPSPSTTLPANISTILVVEKDKPVASNHLVSVITPLLQAAGGLKGPTDFSDDPFKDYRYEDPFSIQDPFADNGGDGCVFQNSDELFRDDSCSEEGDKRNHSVNSSASIVKSLINGSNASQSINTTASRPSSDLQRKLEAIAINSSTLSTAPKETTEVTTSDSVTIVNYRSRSVSPDVPVPLFDAFVDFDSVSSSSKPPTVPIHSLVTKNNSISASSPTTESSNDVDNDSHFFFNSFNDHFDSNSNISAAKWTIMPKISDTFKDNHMDAFGSATKMVDELNENQFEDDFFQSPFKNSDSFTMSDSKNIQTGSMSSVKTRTRNQLATEKKLDTINDSPEECSSEFKTALNNSINFTNSEKGGFNVGHLTSKSIAPSPLVKVQNKSASAKNDDILTANFTADYSKPETFEADLEEVLKRSVMDK